MPPKRILLVVLPLIAAAAVVWLVFAPRPAAPPAVVDPPSPAVRFIGTASCVDCHRQEYELWRTSHHAQAMMVAAESSVLAPFRGEQFVHHGVRSAFFRRDGRYMVSTEGPDGKPHDYEVRYTFGVVPLQQYLVEFPGGRLQTLPLCWDSRPAREGGQRWFHIYGDERIAPGDVLFWTGVAQNWNYMCAECHSTEPRKNFDPASERYSPPFWSEINVACEACHGPGSDHVLWAEGVKAGRKPAPGSRMGLRLVLKDAGRASWSLDSATGNSFRRVPRTSDIQLETCARCHARRTQLTQDYAHGRPLTATHLPALLDEELYFPDGQIRDEVYEYGSFKQSLMHRKGVVCTDCHEAHSMRLYQRGNDLCGRCHDPRKYASATHHFHRPDSTGGSCVDCHMQTRTYMQVDVRRDHSFRVPRPDLSVRLGVPNTCTGCHTGKSNAWAAAATVRWYGVEADSLTHPAVLIAGGRAGSPLALTGLTALAADTTRAGITRGTALSLLRAYDGPAAVGAVQRGLNEADPLLRIGALRSLSILPPHARFGPAKQLLSAPELAVRTEAAGALGEVTPRELDPADRPLLDSARVEYASVQRFNADHPSAHMNLGLLAARQGRYGEAEGHYRKAIAIEPAFMPSYVNLADLKRATGDEAGAEAVLREALRLDPGFAPARYALGLTLVRSGRRKEAVAELVRASADAPDDAGFAYASALALNGEGRSAEAVRTLERALERRPLDRNLLMALASIHRDRGETDAALRNTETLLRFWPDDPGAQQLAMELAGRRGSR